MGGSNNPCFLLYKSIPFFSIVIQLSKKIEIVNLIHTFIQDTRKKKKKRKRNIVSVE